MGKKSNIERRPKFIPVKQVTPGLFVENTGNHRENIIASYEKERYMWKHPEEFAAIFKIDEERLMEMEADGLIPGPSMTMHFENGTVLHNGRVMTEAQFKQYEEEKMFTEEHNNYVPDCAVEEPKNKVESNIDEPILKETNGGKEDYFKIDIDDMVIITPKSIFIKKTVAFGTLAAVFALGFLIGTR